MRRGLVTAAAALATSIALLVAVPALAHEVGLSRGDYTALRTGLRVQITFARKELISLVAGLDANHDGLLTEAELDAAHDSIQGAVVGRVRVRGDGKRCEGTLDRVSLTEEDGAAVSAAFTCPEPPRRVEVELGFLDDLAFGHRHLARIFAGPAPRYEVLSQRSPSFALDVPAGAASPPTPTHDEGVSPFRRGVMHAFAAWQAAVFLLGVLATCAGRRASLVAAAVYLGALEVGFALGARGVFLPSPRALAVATALALVYVGLEARAAPDGEHRWRTAAPFGIVQGLGFATACGAAASDAALRFGAGATLGMLVLAAASMVSMEWARRWRAWRTRGLPALGWAVVAAGVIGLVLARG